MSAVRAIKPQVRLFEHWQALYAALDIPTFPVDGDTKKPLVMRWANTTRHASAAFAQRYPTATAFGFRPGPAGITVLDIDTPDERFLADQIAVYGRPKVLVRTASGKWHCYYANAGESDVIRPQGPNVPFDLKGGKGQIIAPGSENLHGKYEFVEGSLEDLRNLAPMLSRVRREKQSHGTGHGARLRAGEGRNNDLYRHLMEQAPACPDIASLLDVARGYEDDHFEDCLSEGEIIATVNSAWKYQQEGRNFIGRAQQISRQAVLCDGDVLDRLEANGSGDAALLYLALRKRFGGRQEFMIANDARRDAWTFDLSLERLQRARRVLLALKIVTETRAANSFSGPALFCWGSKGVGILTPF